MQLTEEQIRAFAFGAVRVTHTGEGYTFSRMTEESAAAFRQNGRGGACATAGVLLDFYTDSPTLTIAYTGLRSVTSRDFYAFDIACDGVLTASFGENPIERGEGCYTVPLPGGDKRVTVTFPALCTFILRGVEVADGAKLSPMKKEKKILCLGDSITQGYDAMHPSLTYPCQIGEYFRAEVLNQGVGGAQFWPQTLDGNTPFAPDAVTVAYGTNDFYRNGRAEVEKRGRAYMEKLLALYPASRIFLLLPLWRADAAEAPGGEWEACYETIGSFARLSRNITVINGKKLVPHLADFYGDGKLHPNDAGFLCYGKALCREMERVLQLYAKAK